MLIRREMRPKWRWVLRDALVFPVALVVVILEDVVWVAAKRALRAVAGLPPMRVLAGWLGKLPGWAALPCFAVPELLGRVGEVYAFALLFHHHVAAGVAAYIVVRAVATLIVLFIFQSCEPALMRLRWFAWSIHLIHRVRDWARARLAPAMRRLRAALGVSRGGLRLRFAAWRHRLRRRGL